MRNKISIFLAFVIIFSALASADSYILTQKNNDFLYSFDSSSSYLPFSNFDPWNICMKKSGSSIKIADFQIDCDDQFLYRMLNYIIYNKDNMTILYNPASASLEKSSILNLASLLNLSVADYKTQTKRKPFYIGDYSIFSDKINNLPLQNQEAVFYIDESKDYIAIVGNDSSSTINSIKFLANLYSTRFAGNDCVILSGCRSSETQGNIIFYIKQWIIGEIRVKEVIDKIINWKKS